MENDDEILKAQRDYWKNEYSYWADYLELIYGERERFLRLYAAILTAAIAAMGYAVSTKNWLFIIVLTLFIVFLSSFILIIVVYQRIRSTEYKKKIGRARVQLYNLAQFKDDKNLERPTAMYLNPKGADAMLFHMVTGFAGIAAACSAFLFLWITQLKNRCHFYLLIPSAIIGLAIFLYLTFLWRNKLAKCDRNTQDK